MPAFADPADLRRAHLFEGLSAEHLSHLNGLLRRRSFPTGALILIEEQPGETAYVIYEGTVKISVLGDQGADVILAILGAGEIVGEMSLVDSLGRAATVTALERSTLLWIDRASFWEALHTMPALMHNLTRTLSRRVRLANARIEALSALDVAGRLARQLLTLAREYGQPREDGVLIPLHLTQTDLAGLVGASREHVNQTLSLWKRQKYLSVDSDRRIKIHNAAALARRCHPGQG